MTRQKKTCAFCGGEGPFNAEHIMPEWIAALLNIRRVKATATRNNQPIRSWESVGSFGQRMRHVCEDCNGGWMSDLENIAKPILSRLIFPKTPFTAISSDEQLVVACWLWKVCVVLECATDARYFNIAERQCLFNDEGAPPHDTVRMWTGIYTGKNIANLRGGPASFSNPRGGQIPGMLVTLSAGLFAAQVLAVRPPKQTTVNVQTRRDFSKAVTQIWPETGGDIPWPPRVTMNHGDLDLWHRRWNTPPRDE